MNYLCTKSRTSWWDISPVRMRSTLALANTLPPDPAHTPTLPIWTESAVDQLSSYLVYKYFIKFNSNSSTRNFPSYFCFVSPFSWSLFSEAGSSSGYVQRFGVIRIKSSIIFSRSSGPFYIVTYYIKWVTTSRTYSRIKKFNTGQAKARKKQIHQSHYWY